MRLFLCFLLLFTTSAIGQTLIGGGGGGGGGSSTIPTNAQTGTTYTVLASDGGKLVTLSNAAPIAVTLPQAGTTGFAAGWSTCIVNIGTSTATVTPTTSTFNNSSTQTLTYNQAMCPVSDGTNYAGGVSGSGTAPTYTGPGDVATYSFWYGTRAYSTADRGNALLNVCNVSDAACVDMSSSALTGALVVTTVGGSDCSVVTCTVKTLYDRSGNGNDATQTTISLRATLTLNATGGKPCLTFPGTSGSGYTSGGSATLTQPYTLVTVYNIPVASSSGEYLIASHLAPNDPQMGNGGIDLVAISNNSGGFTASATHNVFHSVLGIFNGTSSSITVDGGTPVTSGTNVAGSFGMPAGIGQLPTTTTFTLNGLVCEAGLVDSSLTGSAATTTVTNQRSWYSF